MTLPHDNTFRVDITRSWGFPYLRVKMMVPPISHVTPSALNEPEIIMLIVFPVTVQHHRICNPPELNSKQPFVGVVMVPVIGPVTV